MNPVRTPAARASARSGPFTVLVVSRPHIVAIAVLGAYTFGWLLTGGRPVVPALVCGLDWFLVNLMNRVVDVPEDRANAIPGTSWVYSNRRVLAVAYGVLMVSSFAWTVAAFPRLVLLRAAYHALGLLYNFRLIPWRGHRIRLKEVYGIKNTASAVGFLLTVFGYPIAWAGTLAVEWSYVWVMGLFFFLTELGYEVVYDLRDVHGDGVEGIPTFPVVHGRAAGVRLAYGLMSAGAAVLCAGYAAGLIEWPGFVMVLGPVIQAASLAWFERRGGVTTRDCTVLTWAGASLLLAYNAWVVVGLPLNPWT